MACASARAVGQDARMIYYVEDDTNIRDLIVYALKQAGFEAAGFTCGRDFFKACDEKTPDLVLLDIMLPEMDGLEILRELRSLPSTKNIPVMMLTAKGTEFDKVCGLDAGADDTLVNGPIELVSSAHTVSVGGTLVALTLKEFDLLRALMRSEGRVLSRGRLLEDVWGVTYVGETRTVDVHIQTLRQKLNAASSGADELIRTVRGVGYTMKSAS